jgi:hypothetical protein
MGEGIPSILKPFNFLIFFDFLKLSTHKILIFLIFPEKSKGVELSRIWLKEEKDLAQAGLKKLWSQRFLRFQLQAIMSL